MADAERSVPSPIADAMEKLMANPEIISMVASALQGAKSEEKDETPTEEARAETADAAPASAGGTMPDISALASSLGPLLSAFGKGQSGGGAKLHKTESDNRTALLCALKPYVSDGRREAIDYIIRISQLSDILKQR